MSSSIVKVLVVLISGILFGSGMIISGMTDPTKVIGFLDITGNWDPSLAFVMGGALGVFAPVYHLVIKKRSHAINGEKFAWNGKTTIDRKLILGAIIFGAGWGLAGFCPGPAISNIGSGSETVFIFVACMLIGIIVAKRFYPSCKK